MQERYIGRISGTTLCKHRLVCDQALSDSCAPGVGNHTVSASAELYGPQVALDEALSSVIRELQGLECDQQQLDPKNHQNSKPLKCELSLCKIVKRSEVLHVRGQTKPPSGKRNWG